jgi:NAD dependent epimerase/dehydratase
MSLAGEKVLVTGADGFIGSHVTEALLREGAEVTALSYYNSFDSCGWLDEVKISGQRNLFVVRGDLRDSAFVNRLVKGNKIVFNLAALIAIPYSYAAAQSYVETNILGTLNVLEAAREHGTKRVVQTSTSEVYGTAQTMPIAESHPLHGQSPYAASKIGSDMMSEAYARSFEVPVVILRPFNTYGPRQSERAVVPTIVRQAIDPACGQIMVGDLTTVRDLTYVEDTAAAFIAAGTCDLAYGSAYNAGSERAESISEVLSLILELTGTAKPVCHDTSRTRPQKSEVRALLADASRFHDATGWSAQTSLRDGLNQTIAWWRRRIEVGKVRLEKSYMI